MKACVVGYGAMGKILSDMLKDPIIINTDNKDKLSEKSLKKYILKQLEHLF